MLNCWQEIYYVSDLLCYDTKVCSCTEADHVPVVLFGMNCMSLRINRMKSISAKVHGLVRTGTFVQSIQNRTVYDYTCRRNH